MYDDDSDSGGLGSSAFLFRMLGVSAILPLILLGLVAPLILYLIARSRQNRDPLPDPQLGIKFALSFFQTTSYQLMLGGATVLIYTMISKIPSQFKEVVYRPALGIIVPAAIIFGVHLFALGKTNARQFPLVGKLFAGYSLMVSGLAGMVSMIMVFVLLFSKGESGEPGKIVWAMFLVYMTAWVAQGLMFMRRLNSAEVYLPPPPPPPMMGGPQPLPPPMAQPLG